jgi:hypothetical protein
VPEEYYFAFFDVKLYAPGSHPFTELGEGQLEPPTVLWSGDSVSIISIIFYLKIHGIG